MRKVWHIAAREFMATVGTRGFLVGVLMTPVLILVVVLALPRLINEKSPRVEGEVAIVDPTGQVTAAVRDYLAPAAIAKRHEETARIVKEKVPVLAPGQSALAEEAMRRALGEVPQLDIVAVAPQADLEAEKAPLRGDPQLEHRLALVVVHPDAVVRAAEPAEFGTYDLFVRAKLDDRLEDEIRDALRTAIVDARVRAQGLDRAQIEALTQVKRRASVTVTAEGERRTSEVLNAVLPAGFMLLLLISVMTSGQYLMTTTVEEKASRVVEVLLSAVSPRELLTGKILGQMAVGLTVLLLYSGMGIASLVSFAMVGLLDPMLFVYLVIFFLIAYFVIASLMAGIGAAVNEMREAQTLLTPLTILIMIPWILWMPISRDPNSPFATIISFIPPVNSFAMLLRLTSTSPPPTWQIWGSIAVGLASVWAALWFATKIFRVGLLMFGKPPNLQTLIRWARMA